MQSLAMLVSTCLSQGQYKPPIKMGHFGFKLNRTTSAAIIAAIIFSG